MGKGFELAIESILRGAKDFTEDHIQSPKQCLIEVFGYIKQYGPYDKVATPAFADHGIRHVESLVHRLSVLLEDWKLSPSSPLYLLENRVLLVTAIILHDIGMLIADEGEEEEFESVRTWQSRRARHDKKSLEFIERNLANGTHWKSFWAASKAPISLPRAQSASNLVARIAQSHGDGEPWLAPDSLQFYEYRSGEQRIIDFEEDFGQTAWKTLSKVVEACASLLCALDLAEIGSHRLPVPPSDWEKIDIPDRRIFPISSIHYLTHQVSSVEHTQNEESQWLEIKVSGSVTSREEPIMRKAIISAGPISDALIYGNRRVLIDCIRRSAFPDFCGFRVSDSPKNEEAVSKVADLEQKWRLSTAEIRFPWDFHELFDLQSANESRLESNLIRPCFFPLISQHLSAAVVERTIRLPFGVDRIVRLRQLGLPLELMVETSELQNKDSLGFFIAGRTRQAGGLLNGSVLEAFLGAMNVGTRLALQSTVPSRIYLTNSASVNGVLHNLRAENNSTHRGIIFHFLGQLNDQRREQIGDVQKLLSIVKDTSGARIIFFGGDVEFESQVESLKNVITVISELPQMAASSKGLKASIFVDEESGLIDEQKSSLEQSSTHIKTLRETLSFLRSESHEQEIIEFIEENLRSESRDDSDFHGPAYGTSLVIYIAVLSYVERVPNLLDLMTTEIEAVEAAYEEISYLLRFDVKKRSTDVSSYFIEKGYIEVDGSGRITRKCNFSEIKSRISELVPNKVKLAQALTFVYCFRRWGVSILSSIRGELGSVGPELMAEALTSILSLYSADDRKFYIEAGMRLADLAAPSPYSDLPTRLEFLRILSNNLVELEDENNLGWFISQMCYHAIRLDYEFLEQTEILPEQNSPVAFGLIEALLSYRGSKIGRDAVDIKVKNLISRSPGHSESGANFVFVAMLADTIAKYRLDHFKEDDYEMSISLEGAIEALSVQLKEFLGDRLFALVSDRALQIEILKTHYPELGSNRDEHVENFQTQSANRWRVARSSFLRLIAAVPEDLRRRDSSAFVV